LLKDREYVDSINKIIETESNGTNCNNKGLKWGTLKMLIRGHTISYSSCYKAKNRGQYEMELTTELSKVEDKMANNPDEDTKQEFVTITRELESINNEKTCGNQIRARANHIELNEKNSAYFLQQREI
jgi:hypothetical protein